MLRKIIDNIEFLQKQKAEIIRREQELAKPKLTDMGLIGNIYDMFLSEMKILHPEIKHTNNTMQRSKFILIVLFLYSPMTLCGSKMKRGGLRDKIVEVTGCEKTLISHNCKNVAFYYRAYKAFHDDVDYLYAKITDRLRKIGAME